MTPSPQGTFSRLRDIAVEYAGYAHTPYSDRREAAVLLLSDGSWIPGVRVESAAFSLTIPPLLNAVTTAVGAGRKDFTAAVMSRPFLRGELAYAASMPGLGHLGQHAPDVLCRPECSPEALELLPPNLSAANRLDDRAAISLARSVAARAHVPESEFPVGCVVRAGSGVYIPGVNVEHPDWLYILCAERNALGTCISYRITDITDIYLTCLLDSDGTPCGACRQLILELTPSATLWMDRGEHAPASSHPGAILPGSFRGERLSRRT